MANAAYRSTFETYQSAWSLHISPAERQRRLDMSVAEDCFYTDPGSACHGYAELIAKIEDSNQRFPGASFRIDRFLDHHAQALFSWTMFDGQGNEFVTGASYVRFGADGRLTHLTGFFDTAPPNAFQPEVSPHRPS